MPRLLGAQILEQNLVPNFQSRIPLSRYKPRDVQEVVRMVTELQPRVLGVALNVSEDATINSVALATSERMFYISLDNACRRGEFKTILALDDCPLVSFGMARIVLILYRFFGCHARGVDLGTFMSAPGGDPMSPGKMVYEKINPDVNQYEINALWWSNDERNVCLRAWLSASLAEFFHSQVEQTIQADTDNLGHRELNCLQQLAMNLELLEAKKPTHSEGEIEGVEIVDGKIVITNSRYKTRVRRSEQTTIVMDTAHGETIYGRANAAEGKNTTVKLLTGNARRDVENVRIVGREELTNAERARDEFILRLLRGEMSLEGPDFTNMIWFPAFALAQINQQDAAPASMALAHLGLNPSQSQVANAMISINSHPLVVAHGPPGTGKTRTISAASWYWDQSHCPVWVVAQSNVGVKNIAESFVKSEIDFKILVSKEFYVEWHEHIYGPIEKYLIRSDDLFRDPDPVYAENRLGGSKVILCTLSMLSNPALDDCQIFDLVPMERLVVDEASQIDTSEFMASAISHLFHKFRKNLIKMCLFGDPKQLPPYGQDIAPDLQTIFDFRHLRAEAFFLDIQYRMPVPLGNFISKEVYNSKLQSQHKINSLSCVAFVDVSKGEETQMGQSWINREEVHTVVNLVRNYYRYTEFSIITPYDAQRGEIQKALQNDKNNLPWDCVYNVDSYQGQSLSSHSQALHLSPHLTAACIGHENEFIILSLVRTDRPGFLRSQNRMNVMLTRCKRGMVVVANRRFLETKAAQSTLLGKLAQYWEDRCDAWVHARAVYDRTANLPGAPAPANPLLPAPATPLWPPMVPATALPKVHISTQHLAFAMKGLDVRDTDTVSPQSKLAAPKPDSFPCLPSVRPAQKRDTSVADPFREKDAARSTQTATLKPSYSTAAGWKQAGGYSQHVNVSESSYSPFTQRATPGMSVPKPVLRRVEEKLDGLIPLPKKKEETYIIVQRRK
ncbi:nucleoside triphosphate hydrolase protein [Wolfiporia cocos MD-104 SS10]|uniref:Nucleoside triphosphate hydrolase protein n=1 Tax=Wolfiporia cocos (strain MD-104) TaxID=742152 RepID=A0A2H3IZZ8_WOLCO|nr:nucleoside triphosphate hydrolase protein [Wolfiporia cocos MD-104 SS10]